MMRGFLIIMALVPSVTWANSINKIKRAEPPCRESFTAPQGNFTSPEFPEDYPNGVLCTWEIIAAEEKRIRLSFPLFHLEASLDCVNDYLEIFDGSSYASYCGREVPPVTESVANGMSVVLYTDQMINVGDKFVAEYVTFDESECQYSVDVTDSSTYGFFKSRNHPEPYPANSSCRYEVLRGASSEFDTRVSFLRLRTNDAGDVATILLNGTQYGNYSGDYQVQTGNLEAGLLPVISAQENNVTVLFQSDAQGAKSGFLLAYASEVPSIDQEKIQDKKIKPSVIPGKQGQVNHNKEKTIVNMDFTTGSVNQKGFISGNLAHFGSPDGQEAKQDDEVIEYGFFMSPNHPKHYDDNTTVVYNITVVEGHQVALSFLRLALEIRYDLLYVNDVKTGETTLFNGYDEPPTVWLSTGNRVEAIFDSDYSDNRTGFLVAVAEVEISPQNH